MVVQHTCFIGLLLVSAALAAIGQQRAGWLDRVVQYQKEKLFNEIRELVPININAEIRPKPEGYKDSEHWDYDSVLRLLTLIRGSETAKPVYKALRRMLQPTRRLMMSMKESMHRFPSIKKDDNAFYYDVDYNSEEGSLPAPPPVPEDQVVLVVSNPVEARLPSARISVKLLRQILEARAQAARQMPSTTHKIPWEEFVKKRNSTTTASTDAVRTTTEEKASDEAKTTTVVEGTTGDGETTDAGGEATTDAGGEATTDAGGEATTNTGGEATTDAGEEATTDAGGTVTNNAGEEATTDAGGEATTAAGGEATTDAGGEATTDAGGKATTDAGEDATTDAGGEATTDAGGTVTNNAGEETTTDTVTTEAKPEE